jgi:hypothetical protein
MKRLLGFWIVLILCGGPARAQTAVATRNVNLRPNASTDDSPIEKIKSGAQLQLLETHPTNGFYHVQAPDRQSGFVWAKNVRVQEIGSNPTPTSGQTLFARLMASRKTAVGQPLSIDGTEVCGPEGDATSQAAQKLNDNKNRTDVPGQTEYVEIAWDDLKNLPKNRVSDFEGAPVTVIGFLSHQIKVETGGESTNCHLHANAEVDWHIYLTKSPAQGIRDAIIVETTPRTRPSHTWTTTMLHPLVDARTQVRIGGWLMYDFEHTGVIGTQRATVWEVHPITRIEVQQNGQWIDLDDPQ